MNCVERCRYIHLFTEMFCLSAQTLILLMAFAVVQSLGYPEIHSNQSGYGDSKRKERAVKVIGAQVFAGMRGTQDFLRHAKLIISTNDHRVYKKSGGLRQAQEDFKAVQPTSIQETKGKWYRYGKIGNRPIVISREGWHGKPTVDIYSFGPNRRDSEPTITTIVYMD